MPLTYDNPVYDLYGSMAEEARTVVPVTNQHLMDFCLSDASRFPVARHSLMELSPS
jgi:hypothetical protein